MTVKIELVDWDTHKKELFAVRNAVFVQEQNVPVEIEMDEKDPLCKHVLAWDNFNNPVGTGRIDRTGKVGRMAVLADFRGQNVGRQLLDALIKYGKSIGLNHFHLSSQVSAIGFYEKSGFNKYGDIFVEAGIDHINMELK